MDHLDRVQVTSYFGSGYFWVNYVRPGSGSIRVKFGLGPHSS